MEKLIYNVSQNQFGEIILTVTYKTEILPKHITYVYQQKTLQQLFLHQGKNDFMTYQFKYISEQISNNEAKEEFLIRRQQIREDVLKLISVE